jgi:hypothetical protein
MVDGLFQEAFQSQKKDNTPLLHLIHSNDLNNLYVFGRFFNSFFQGFVV